MGFFGLFNKKKDVDTNNSDVDETKLDDLEAVAPINPDKLPVSEKMAENELPDGPGESDLDVISEKDSDLDELPDGPGEDLEEVDESSEDIKSNEVVENLISDNEVSGNSESPEELITEDNDEMDIVSDDVSDNKEEITDEALSYDSNVEEIPVADETDEVVDVPEPIVDSSVDEQIDLLKTEREEFDKYFKAKKEEINEFFDMVREEVQKYTDASEIQNQMKMLAFDISKLKNGAVADSSLKDDIEVFKNILKQFQDTKAEINSLIKEKVTEIADNINLDEKVVDQIKEQLNKELDSKIVTGIEEKFQNLDDHIKEEIDFFVFEQVKNQVKGIVQDQVKLNDENKKVIEKEILEQVEMNNKKNLELAQKVDNIINLDEEKKSELKSFLEAYSDEYSKEEILKVLKTQGLSDKLIKSLIVDLDN